MLSIRYKWKYATEGIESWDISYYGDNCEQVWFQQDFKTPQEAHDGLVEFLKGCQYFDDELTLITYVRKD